MGGWGAWGGTGLVTGGLILVYSIEVLLANIGNAPVAWPVPAPSVLAGLFSLGNKLTAGFVPSPGLLASGFLSPPRPNVGASLLLLLNIGGGLLFSGFEEGATAVAAG